jgi:hypothetical protein
VYKTPGDIRLHPVGISVPKLKPAPGGQRRPALTIKNMPETNEERIARLESMVHDLVNLIRQLGENSVTQTQLSNKLRMEIASVKELSLTTMKCFIESTLVADDSSRQAMLSIVARMETKDDALAATIADFARLTDAAAAKFKKLRPPEPPLAPRV